MRDFLYNLAVMFFAPIAFICGLGVAAIALVWIAKVAGIA